MMGPGGGLSQVSRKGAVSSLHGVERGSSGNRPCIGIEAVESGRPGRALVDWRMVRPSVSKSKHMSYGETKNWKSVYVRAILTMSPRPQTVTCESSRAPSIVGVDGPKVLRAYKREQ